MNTWKIAIARILFKFWLIGAIYILYFQFLGFNFNEIGLFEAVTSVAIIITDVPSGVLADSIGRKWTVFIANVFMLLMVLLLGSSAGGLTIILLAGLLNGLEFSFKSGAESALLYDTLKELGREGDYLKISGKINAFSQLSSLAGLILGAYLYTVNPRLPYWILSGFIGVSLIFIATIQEPIKLEKSGSLKEHARDMVNSVQFIFRNRLLLWLTAFFLVADVFAESYWDVYSQAHLTATGLNPAVLGAIFAFLALVNAVFSYFVADIEKKLGEKRSYYSIILVQGVLFFLLACFDLWVALVLLLAILVMNREYSGLLEETYSNRQIPSATRASVLSAMSFLRNGLFGGAVIIWLFGLSLDIFGGKTTLIMTGTGVLVTGLFLIHIRAIKWQQGHSRKGFQG
ncbi:MAG: MFS transporter [Candidatus Odinarchaeota archaeon]